MGQGLRSSRKKFIVDAPGESEEINIEMTEDEKPC